MTRDDGAPPVPDNEEARLRALRRYNVLDTPPDEALDDLVALAAYVCETPIAVISLVDADRSWYISRFGITTTESTRGLSICAHAICGPDLFIVPDAQLDARFAENPLVTGEPRIRFYAGARLVSPDGYALGTLCVIDHVARTLRPNQEQALGVLARHVMTQLELRSRTRQFSDLQATHAELLKAQQTLRAQEMKLEEQYEELNQIYSIQRRLTETLSNNEQHYRLLFDNNPQAMWVCDPQTLAFLAVNQKAIDQYSYSREEFLAMTIADVRPREDVEKLMMMLVTSPDQARQYFNVRHRRKDGTTLSVDITSHPIVFSGRLARLVLATDVTERAKAEEVQRRLATAVEQVAESIIIADPDGTIVYVNPAFERITGYSPEEAVGKNPRILKSGVHDFTFYREMWDTISAGHVWSGTVTNRRKDGHRYTEEMTISPIRDATGNIINYVAVTRDVTREVALEMQLRQAQKMEAIGLLAGGVAHDFNNLLTVIQGNAAFLLDDKRLSTSTTSIVKEIVEAAERAAGLTRQLLVFSRKQTIQLTQLALNDVVGNLASILNRILGETLSLRCEYGTNLPLVHADSGMLEQVLLNLVVNARDAMSPGGQLEIATSVEMIEEADLKRYPDAAPGHYVCLRVTDAGFGIAPENFPRIFEPFFTTKEVGKGTGLGLSTVYGIVKQHHGWIDVVSEVNNGSTFRIYLPAVLPTL